MPLSTLLRRVRHEYAPVEVAGAQVRKGTIMQNTQGIGYISQESEKSWEVTFISQDNKGIWKQYRRSIRKADLLWVHQGKERFQMSPDCLKHLEIILRDMPGIDLVSSDDYLVQSLPLLHVGMVADEQARHERQESVYAQESELICSIALLAPRPRKPTLVEALEQGCVLCPKIPAEQGTALKKEQDGSYSASLLGALYVGCVGLEGIDPSLLNANTMAWNASCMKMLEAVKGTIRYWRKSSGEDRNFGMFLAIGGSGMGRAVRQQVHSFENLLLGRCPGDMSCWELSPTVRLLYREQFAQFDASLLAQAERDHQKYLFAAQQK